MQTLRFICLHLCQMVQDVENEWFPAISPALHLLIHTNLSSQHDPWLQLSGYIIFSGSGAILRKYYVIQSPFHAYPMVPYFSPRKVEQRCCVTKFFELKTNRPPLRPARSPFVFFHNFTYKPLFRPIDVFFESCTCAYHLSMRLTHSVLR